MDVHSLALNTGFSLPNPRRGRRDRLRAIDLAPPKPDGGGDQTGDHAVASTRRLLLAYTAASTLLGLGALAWTTLTVPLLPGIDPGLDGTSLAGPAGGLLLWIAFGLVGSLRVLPIPGSSAVWTFHLPFIAAAMVLGGPTAGAWVAFLATLERRELESQPWYGTLANHAVLTLGAVVGGLTVLVARGALVAAGAEPGAANMLAIAAGTIVLAVTANGLAAVTVILRERLAPMALVDILVRSLGRVTLAEIGLASVFVVSYVAIGWWAPLALAVVVLVIWPGEGFEGLDPMTQMPRQRQFERELDSVLNRARHGIGPGGLLLSLDLIGFGQVNREIGHKQGDEVLEEIGRRLHELMRSTDLIGRIGGDEIAMFYAGIVDRQTGEALAARVEFCDPATDLDDRRRDPGGRLHRRGHRATGGRPPGSERAHALGRSRDAGPEARPAGGNDPEAGQVPPLRPHPERRPGARRRLGAGSLVDRPGRSARDRGRRGGGPRRGDDGRRVGGAAGDLTARMPAPHRRQGAQRQMGVPPCSPTSSRPSANRDGANGAMSTDVATPSRISSAMPSPIAGAVLKPVPLWPQSR